MKYLNIDWTNLIDRLDVWATLAPESRDIFLQLGFNQYIVRSAFNDDDLDAMVAAHLLAFSADREKLRVDPDDSGFSKAMRAMNRHRLDIASDERQLASYTSDHLTNEETRCLLRDGKNANFNYYYGADLQVVMQRDWPQQALDMPSASVALKWERARMPDRPSGTRFRDGAPYFLDKVLFDATRMLVKAAMTWPEPVPLAELARRVPDVEPPLLYRAIMPAVRYLWLFVWLEEKTLKPMIGLWPGITHLLHRPAPRPPQPVTPEATFHAPLRIEDMVTVLVTAAAEPLRVLAAGGGLYAKDTQRIASATMAAPPWLLGDGRDETTFSPGHRVLNATQACIEQKLLAPHQDGRGRNRLEITDAGQAWVAMNPHQRIADMIDPWRVEPQPDKPAKARGRSSMRIMVAGKFVDFDDGDLSPWIPQEFRWGSDRTARQVDWRAAFADALADGDGAFMPIDDLLDYHARVNNPLLGRRRQGSYGPTLRVGSFGYPRESLGELELEAMWANMIRRTLARDLLPLGAIEYGFVGDVFLLKLHAIGRYMLGLADDFTYHAAAEGDVIISPNFEVTFLGPSPRAEAMIGRLAERTGARSGTMFRITRASILTAAAVGITADDALRDLAEVSSKPLPDNVKREVRGWFDTTRHVRMRHAWLIDAPDEPTAVRIAAAATGKARQLTPTLVELTTAKKDHAALIRKLKQAGIFVR